MTVTRTLAEITATGTKAVRGAGCHWGLAEEAGLAARVLEAHGLPGVKLLADVLASERKCNCTGGIGSAGCTIAALAAVSDRIHLIGDGELLEFDALVAAPLLLAPLLMAAGRTGMSFSLAVPDAEFLACPSGVVVTSDAGATGPVAAVRAVVQLAEPGTEQPMPPTTNACQVDKSAWDALEQLAFRTYVPETAESRARGAGSGETRDE